MDIMECLMVLLLVMLPKALNTEDIRKLLIDDIIIKYRLTMIIMTYISAEAEFNYYINT